MAEAPTFRQIYNAYRHTKGLLDAAMYHPDYSDCDPPTDVIDPLEDAHLEAIDRMLLFPVSKPQYLHMKLCVYKSECLYVGWNRGAEVASVLADDAERIVRDTRDRRAAG